MKIVIERVHTERNPHWRVECDDPETFSRCPDRMQADILIKVLMDQIEQDEK